MGRYSHNSTCREQHNTSTNISQQEVDSLDLLLLIIVPLLLALGGGGVGVVGGGGVIQPCNFLVYMIFLFLKATFTYM